MFEIKCMQFSDTQVPLAGALSNFYGVGGRAGGLSKLLKQNACNFLKRRCPRGSARQIFTGWVEGRGIAKKLEIKCMQFFNTQVPPR